MLGPHRGVRLWLITYPDIYDIQVQVIGEAVSQCARASCSPMQIMIPLVMGPEELNAYCASSARGDEGARRRPVPFTHSDDDSAAARVRGRGSHRAARAPSFSFGTNQPHVCRATRQAGPAQPCSEQARCQLPVCKWPSTRTGRGADSSSAPPRRTVDQAGLEGWGFVGGHLAASRAPVETHKTGLIYRYFAALPASQRRAWRERSHISSGALGRLPVRTSHRDSAGLLVRWGARQRVHGSGGGEACLPI